MKTKNLLLTTLLAVSPIISTGCAPAIENIVRYTPTSTNVVSSDVSGISIGIDYRLSRDASVFRTIFYDISNKNTNKILLSSYVRGKTNLAKALNITNPGVLGSIGDKLVFVWKNGGGYADAYLSVYDFSEKRTYHIVGPKEKFSIYKNGNSYVVKNLTTHSYVSLNDLKKVKIDESRYELLTLGYYYSGLDNRGRFGKRQSVFTPSKADFYISSAANSFGRLDALMIGDASWKALRK
jgi:hypothetical protein